MPVFLIMGAPGAGKGTQAAILASDLGIPAISTGDIFRSHVGGQTPIGLEAQRFLDAGEYVPDELTNRMLGERLGQRDTRAGFLLDGYPRTVGQVDVLDELLAARATSIRAVVVLTVDTEEVVRRLLERGQTDLRSDDGADVVRRRQQLYIEQTAPIIETYQTRNLTAVIDAAGSVDEVSQRIRVGLERVPAQQ